MTASFLGIPVDGDIVRAERKANQRPLEEFAPLLQAVLNDSHIIEFGWTQYTPYFNDGDPCVFRAYGTWFRTDDPADENICESELNLHDCACHALGLRVWNPRTRTHDMKQGAEPWKYETFERANALYLAIGSGSFDDVLLDAFGEHAHITVRRDGIKIGFYSHD